jgi:glycosyltransferase involved in cell wall biosynthesis
MSTLSIIICTYNNSASLLLTLNQLIRCDIPDNHEIELILVDNNSTDQTAEVCKKTLPRFPFETSYAVEKKQGLSHARNLGLDLSDGEYLLFTDDDADIPRNWIREYLNVIEKESPHCAFSKIEVIWSQPKPWWYVKQYRPYFVELNYGENNINVTDYSKEFYGKNFCVKQEFLKEIGGFDPNLGRVGTVLLAGEETQIYRKLIDSGKHVVYFPSALVGHRLKEREYSEENIEKLFLDGAYSIYLLSRSNAKKSLFGRPLYILKDSITKLVIHYLQLLFKSDTKQTKYFHRLKIRQNKLLLKLWIMNP